MERAWKSRTAGILALVAGCCGIGVGVTIAAASGIIAGILSYLVGVLPSGFGAILAAAGGAMIGLGIVALIGGIFALRRRVWGLALAGAICAAPLLPPGPALGTLAIVFVALGKREFA
jgi:hypothetical protein